MRVGIYDPYLNTLGGGEKYVFTAASCLSKKHQVEVFWHDPSIVKKASKKFNLNLVDVKIVNAVFSSKISLLQRLLEMKKYDILLFVSDGSIPFLSAKKNIILFQFPVNWVKGKSFLNRIKFKNIDAVICYTKFVKKYLDKTFSKEVNVLYPPVQQIKSTSSEKENIILTVGRFTKAMNAKKQEVLISVFKKMYQKELKTWKLVVAGSYLPEDKDFVENLKKKSSNYPIEIETNITFEKLADLYKKAKIYWHAAGFGEDLERHPEFAEHFGISTVEAMGAGVVPVVINAGGQKEIVTENKNGFLWDSLDELQNKTLSLINDQDLLSKLSKQAEEDAKKFSKEIFCEEINNLVLK